jgi:hypothetical protein
MQVSAGEAVVRLLEQSSPGIIARFGVEADLVKILQHPTTSIACDCGAVAREASHPRYYGTFPRVLGRYTRDQKALTWENAVRKMTGLPAATVGMVDRGRLAVGMAADVVAFDPATVIDHATFDEPTLPSDGIRFVLVNGRIAIRDGKPTEERGGRALFRTAHMPTRPMAIGEKQRLSHHAQLGPARSSVRIALDVAQDARAPHASGTFQFVDPTARIAIDMKEIGVLQTFGRWGSFTGRAALRPSDEERSMTVTIDGTTLVIDAGPAFSITRELGEQRR